MIPQGATHVQPGEVQPPERSLKYMAWNIKEIAGTLKEIANSLAIMNNRADRIEAASMRSKVIPMAPAVQKMVDDAAKGEDIPF